MQKTIILLIFALSTLACSSLELPVPDGIAYTVTAAQNTKAANNTTNVTASPTSHPRCVVNTSTLNFRACAGTQCTTQTWLREGEVLTILSAQDQWLQVETQSHITGWVHSKFCTGE